ncbi:hypothetical protein ACHAXA_006380 [Cyclostephanos tholiformis]|uniref:tRNA-5-taurinomethyluridine 2-sulfurtransferase n=1 Tax=Cyclostephanos tholiformis TaxID=382380 RepID=A0ABD3SDZ4_9STRA
MDSERSFYYSRQRSRGWRIAAKPLILCHLIAWISWRMPPARAAFAYHRPQSPESGIIDDDSRSHKHHRCRQPSVSDSAGGGDGDGTTRRGYEIIDDHNIIDELPPLFVEGDDNSSMEYSSTRYYRGGVPSRSMMNSIERARKKLLVISDDGVESRDNDGLLRRIVQEGIRYEQTRGRHADVSYASGHSHGMERVPGCIATVHLRVTLIPLTEDPGGYRAILTGTADAMLSGGLLAILAEIIGGGARDDTDIDAHDGGGVVTSDDILILNPETFTAAMGLRSVLSRGRNDGVASMIRVIQRQITSLLGEGVKSSSDGPATMMNAAGGKLSPSLDTSLANMRGRGRSGNRGPSVAMLLSGGVDSSVALHLLLRQNYNVTAFYLRIWLEDELSHLGECPWEEDLMTCRAVCEHAGNVPLETVSLGDEYRERVIQYTIEEARRGRTPNPDIMCNSRVKFGCFLEYIDKSGMGFDYVASGHYARVEDETPTTAMGHPKKRLFRAPDPIKDQSYFLCALTQNQLSNVLFPIGAYHKSEVRELAMRFQLPNRNRPDSQGLCFLGKVRFDDFISSYLGTSPGDVIDALNGEVIGRHNGLWYHTVGQRKGIGKVMFPLATARDGYLASHPWISKTGTALIEHGKI